MENTYVVLRANRKNTNYKVVSVYTGIFGALVETEAKNNSILAKIFGWKYRVEESIFNSKNKLIKV